ncbi:MAG TPA: hypothetical protein VMZ28_25140 [Kofleriaceae bacterium]|nr:hypothetical protein [Kofleriaceae bacterium]
MRLVLLALLLAACEVGDVPQEAGPDAGVADDDDADLQALTDVGGTTVIQVNPYYGGQYDTLDRSQPITHGTARRFARMVRERYHRASVIGMQEITSADNAETIRQILVQETGRPWGVRHFSRGTYPGALPSSQEAIFWRSDVHHVASDFGTRQVELIDTDAGASTQSLRFGGLLLRRTGTFRDLAVFVGKLAPPGHRRDGRLLDNGDRAAEVDRLRHWMTDELEHHRHATRVVLLDANASVGTAPWRHLDRALHDGDATAPTHFAFGARRIDHVFWDMDAGPRRTDGFLDGPFVSPAFGSDHRAVVARIYVRE